MLQTQTPTPNNEGIKGIGQTKEKLSNLHIDRLLMLDCRNLALEHDLSINELFEKILLFATKQDKETQKTIFEQ